MNRTSYIRLLRIATLVIVVIVIIIYAIWRSADYVRGPSITIFEPQNGLTATSSTVDIIGRADRITDLSINGYSVPVDEKGNFKETLITFPGINIWTVIAKDRFNRTVSKTLEILGH